MENMVDEFMEVVKLDKKIAKKTFLLSKKMDKNLGSTIRRIIQEDNEANRLLIEESIKTIYNDYYLDDALHNCLVNECLKDEDIIWCLQDTIVDIEDKSLQSFYTKCALKLLKCSYSKRKKIVRKINNQIINIENPSKMLNKILRNKQNEDDFFFDVDENSSIFVEYFEDDGIKQIEMDLRDIDTNESYFDLICDDDVPSIIKTINDMRDYIFEEKIEEQKK